MLQVSDFSTEICTSDSKFIEELGKSIKHSNVFYDNNGMDYVVSEFDPETFVAKTIRKDLSLFGTLEDQTIEFLTTSAGVTPEQSEVFHDYLAEMQSEMTDQGVRFFNEYANTEFFYCEERKSHGEPPFMAVVNGEKLYFNSMVLAAKFGYEDARKRLDYLGPDSRKKLANWTEYLDSEEFKSSLQKDIDEQKAYSDELEVFFESERYEEIMSKLPEIMASNGISMINKSPYRDENKAEEFITEQEYVWLIDLAFRKGEVSEDPDADFKTEKVTHGKLQFIRIYGQGVAESIHLEKD